MIRSVTHAVLMDGDKKVAEFPLVQRDEKDCFSTGALGYYSGGKTVLKDGQTYQVGVNVIQVGSKNTLRAAEYETRKKAADAVKAAKDAARIAK